MPDLRRLATTGSLRGSGEAHRSFLQEAHFSMLRLVPSFPSALRDNHYLQKVICTRSGEPTTRSSSTPAHGTIAAVKHLLLPVLLATWPGFLTGAFAATVPASSLEADIALLARMNVLTSTNHWLSNAVAGRQCDGAKVRDVLLNLARVFEPASGLPEALQVLERKKIIWNDYWSNNAVAGKNCRGEYVANLFHAAAAPLAESELLSRFGVPAGLVPAPEPSVFTLPATKIETFNYVIGTQTFQPSYQFTKEPRLVETAEAIRALGCSVIKFEMSPRYAQSRGNAPQKLASVRSLTDLARDEPSHRRVLDMPFAHFVLWAHTFGGGEGRWRKGFSKAAAEAEHREIYEFTTHLLKTYRGSGKIFYLGHWEGDGWLRGTVAAENDVKVTPEAAQGMADWLNTRQRAVDDAKRDTPPHGVQVWNYTEVNHVKLAMQGRPALVNRVLPKANVDLVSYSSYDTQADPQMLKAALTYIESQLPPKPGITGRRVFIGEYGFPKVFHTPEEQARRSRAVMTAGIEWGCPLILYWELYNNEVDATGRQRGFWLIDDQGAKQPVYESHRQFLERARQHVAAVTQTNGRPPSHQVFRAEALRLLAEIKP